MSIYRDPDIRTIPPVDQLAQWCGTSSREEFVLEVVEAKLVRDNMKHAVLLRGGSVDPLPRK